MYTFRKYETIIANGFMCLYLIKGLNFYGCLLFLMDTYFTLNLYLDFITCFILCKINNSTTVMFHILSLDVIYKIKEKTARCRI